MGYQFFLPMVLRYKLQNILGRKQPVRLGDGPAAARERLQVEASDAHRRADDENKRNFEEEVDS